MYLATDLEGPEPTVGFVLITDDGCWMWQGAKTKGGYGHAAIDGRLQYIHRWTYEQQCGEIPAGYHIDHKCRRRACCNPEHLEAVTPTENQHRKRRALCSRGHPKSGQNLYVSPKGHRKCRKCHAERNARAFRRGAA